MNFRLILTSLFFMLLASVMYASTLVSPNSESFSETLTLSIDANRDLNDFNFKENKNKLGTYLTLSTDSLFFEKTSGNATFGVNTDLESWEVTSNVSWISISGANNSLNDPEIFIQISENNTIAEREGIITVSGIGLSESIIVTQAESEPFLRFAQDSLIIPNQDTIQRVTIISNTSWELSEDESWLSYSGGSGFGTDSTAFLNITENTSFSERTGYFALAAIGSDLQDTLFIVQEGASLPEPAEPENVVVNQINADNFPEITSYNLITDDEQIPIDYLTKSNFRVLEDGEEVDFELTTVNQSNKLLLLSNSNNAISVGLLLDRSGSMGGTPITNAKLASKTFIQNLQSNDEAAIFSFSNLVSIDQGFTSDRLLLNSAIDGLFANGPTSFYDGIIVSINETDKRNNRAAVIALTDGDDTSSNSTLDEAILAAQTLGIPVFTIGLGGAVESILENIANETGGLYFYTPDSQELEEIYFKISQQLRNQYEIRYTTPNLSCENLSRTFTIEINTGGRVITSTREYTISRDVCEENTPNPTNATIAFDDIDPVLETTNTFYPNGLYDVEVTYTDPDGADDIVSAYLQLEHPNGVDYSPVLQWNQADESFYPWEVNGTETYIDTLLCVEKIATNDPNSIRLKWRFVLKPNWVETSSGINLTATTKDQNYVENAPWVWSRVNKNYGFQNPLGITILTHGLSLTGDESYIRKDTNPALSNSALIRKLKDYWEAYENSMAKAYGAIQAYYYDSESGDFLSTTNPSIKLTAFNIPRDKQVIIYHDWLEVSNNGQSGQAEAAAEAFFASLVKAGLIDPANATKVAPMHFIGHSRGTMVNSEIIQRMGYYDIEVDYATYLDIHDFEEFDAIFNFFDADYHDPSPQIWSNIIYADNYYQHEDKPTGRKLNNLSNYSKRQLFLKNYSTFRDWETKFGGHINGRLGSSGKSGAHGYVKNFYGMTINHGLIIFNKSNFCGDERYCEEDYKNLYNDDKQIGRYYAYIFKDLNPDFGYNIGFNLWRKYGGFSIHQNYVHSNSFKVNPSKDNYENNSPENFQSYEFQRNGRADGTINEVRDGNFTTREDNGNLLLFNGDFDLPKQRITNKLRTTFENDIAGWHFHGGQIPQIGIDIKKSNSKEGSHLIFTNEFQSTETISKNRIYIPYDVSSINLDILSDKNSRNPSILKCFIGNQEIGSFDIDFMGSQTISYTIPANLKNTVNTIQFEFTDNSFLKSQKLVIDNIEFSKSQPQSTPVQPIAYTEQNTSTLNPTFRWSDYASLSNIAQEGYQVRVFNAGTDQLIYDTGLIRDLATSHTVDNSYFFGQLRMNFFGTYRWSVRVKDVNGQWSEWTNSSPSNFNTFTLFEPVDKSVVLLSPLYQSATFTAQQTIPIEWEAININANDNIDLSLVNSRNGQIFPITTIDANAENYDWTIPNDVPTNDDYVLQAALSVGGASKSQIISNQVSAQSEYTFDIFNANNIPEPVPVLQLKDLDTPQDWVKDDIKQIDWFMDDIEDVVVLELLRGDSLIREIGRAEATNQTIQWRVPEEIEAGTNYQIKIFAIADSTIEARSAAISISEAPEGQIRYDISSSVWPLDAGIVDGTGLVTSGVEVTLQARSTAEFTFLAWQINNQTISTENPFTFTPTSDSLITAVFTAIDPINKSNLTVAAEPAFFGSVSGIEATSLVDNGRTLALFAEPKEGYLFDAWISEGDTISRENPINFVVSTDTTLIAHFKAANDIYIAANGVTIVCDDAEMGDSQQIGDITYTKRSRAQITAENAESSCTSTITDMSELFSNNQSFNADLSTWDVSNVTNMGGMFAGASQFEGKGLSKWDISNVSQFDLERVDDNGSSYIPFVENTSISTAAYDSILINWSQLDLVSNITVSFNGLNHSDVSTNAKQNIIDQYGWTINDNGLQSVGYTFQSTMGAGWQLVGLPVRKNHTNYLELFTGASEGQLFGFEGSYQEATMVEEGKGYWLYFSANSNIEINGDRIDTVQISLNEGWNLISGPSETVPINQIEDSEGILQGSYFGFEGSYTMPNEMEGGKGYWVLADANGIIKIPGSTAANAKNLNNQITLEKLLFESENNYSTIVLYQNDEIIQTFYFDYEGDTNSSLINKALLPPLPPNEVFDVRLKGNTRLIDDYSAELRLQAAPSNLALKIFGPENQNESTYEIVISAKGQSDISKTVEHGEFINLNSKIERIIVKSIELEDLPTEYALDNAYPNPFNPTTNIGFALPEQAFVRLEIFNIQGQKVATLINEQREAGRYVESFNASHLPSGVYLYRIQAGNFSQTKKILLLK